MPKISLVVAVYNLEKYISECLDSILNQTFTDFEVIVVNDGSTDGTLKILEEYALKDTRIKIINQQNRGAGSARTRGMKEITGKYFQMLDGDDYFEPDMLEKLFNLAEKHSADIAVCSSRKVDDSGHITESKNPNSPINLLMVPIDKPFSYKDFPDDIFSLIGNVPWNKLYLTSLAKDNGLEYPSIIGGEDMCFVLMALACAQKVVVIDDELINYRFNRPGSVYTYRANHASDIARTSIIVENFLRQKGLYEELKNAHKMAFISAMRWEISLCNDEQYEKFIKEIKEIMPDKWQDYEPAFRKDYITAEYLDDFIGNRNVFLWGASNFIRNVLESQHDKNEHILGVIDGNTASWGTKCGKYKIFPETVLNSVECDGIVLTVMNNNELIYSELKKIIDKKYSHVELLPNILSKKY